MSVSSYELASKKSNALADKLAKMAHPEFVERVVAQTTAETQAIVIDNITENVRPHDAHRSQGFVQGVTDLVDTGAYRASVQTSFPSQFSGRVSTNIVYAAKLEYGDENLKGFFVFRTSAAQAKKLFIKNFQDAIKEAK